MIDLAMAIPILRKNISLLEMKRRILTSKSISRQVAANGAAISRTNRPVQAALRICISSPMDKPRAIKVLSATPLLWRIAAPSAGPRYPAIHFNRSTTSALLPPKRMTLPIPSLIVQKARLPNVVFSTTRTGRCGVVIPVIGPTALNS